RAGESTPGAIASFEHVSPPVMTRILGRLEDAGLVLRDAHPGDGRQVRVTLTAEGQETVDRGRRERDEWLRSGIGATDDAERRTPWEPAQILHRNLVQRRDRPAPIAEGRTGPDRQARPPSSSRGVRRKWARRRAPVSWSGPAHGRARRSA